MTTPLNKELATNAIQIGSANCKLTHTGMTFNKGTSFEEWQETGIRLGQANRITGFALGDWLNFGQSEYGGGKYKDAIPLTGLDEQTLTNMASVAAKYQPSERVDMLVNAHITFTHHQEVAYIEDKKLRADLLNKATKEKLTVKALRDLVPKKKKKKSKKAQENKAKAMAKQLAEIVKFLRGVKAGNDSLLVEFYDPLYELSDELPDLIARSETAKEEAKERAKAIAAAEKAAADAKKK